MRENLKCEDVHEDYSVTKAGKKLILQGSIVRVESTANAVFTRAEKLKTMCIMNESLVFVLIRI